VFRHPHASRIAARLSFASTVCALWLGCLCARVHAQAGSGAELERASGPETSDARIAQARDHFTLALRFFEAHSYSEALREFELVSALAPSADVWFNIGRVHEELGEYPRAVEAFGRYLNLRVDAPDADAVHARIARLQQLVREVSERERSAPDTGSLRIHSKTIGARIFVDGQPLLADVDEPLLLIAGRHRLDVVASSYLPMHAQVDVQPVLLTAAYADLQPRTEVRTAPASRAFSLSLLALAGAGALTGAALSGASIAHQADGSIQSAQRWARAADVAFAGTAVCALAAVIVYFVEERARPTELSRTVVQR
jgi:tetratricopeptide (TPR) repeat protein